MKVSDNSVLLFVNVKLKRHLADGKTEKLETFVAFHGHNGHNWH